MSSTTTVEETGGGYRPADGFRLMTSVLALIAMIGAFVGAGLAFRARDEAKESAATTGLIVAVELGDLFVEPSVIEVAAGTRLTLEITNVGDLPHDLKLGDVGTRGLQPGEDQTVDFGVINETVQAWCTVPGHKEGGMTLDIVVADGAAPVAAPADSTTATTAETAFATIDPQAKPADGWEHRNPALDPAPGVTVHDVTFGMTEELVEVAPGVTQMMWTYDGQVPGPMLRGKVGDVFNVTIVNEGELGHSIDFHASKVAWNDEMRTIGPGESLTYTFEAKHAGIFMYHCGTAPALHHIGNGMYGAIVIDPPELAPVDHEFFLVQSELYLGPEGEPGDLTKMQNEDWDAVVFNGYFNQYLHQPIRVEPNERVRVWVVDDGPSENSAFHIVGTIFDTVYKEGAYLLRPDDGGTGGAQVIDLQPAQGGFVEFSFDEAGLYPIVTHKFANVGKGALGLFQAGEIETAEDDGAAH
jgi:nitrite reductase (NO-forming)